MGFYFRKSFRLGRHLRLNLSKSGVGISTGIKGFRIGSGPRGTYVHAGRGGFYYHANLSPGRSRHSGSSHAMRNQYASADAPTATPREELIESGSLLEMQDVSASGLLAELNRKRRLYNVWPPGTALWILITWATWTSVDTVGHLVGLVGIFVVATILGMMDAARKTTVITYSLDAEAGADYRELVDGLLTLGRSERLWHIPSRTTGLDGKYNAGVQSASTRTQTAIRIEGIPLVKCNVQVPSLKVGKQTLYFLPDHLLVFDRIAVGAIGYSALRIAQGRTDFVETQPVPSDAKVVRQVWLHSNKDGGPDRRFRDNPALPVCKYETIHFSSDSGLNELVYASRLGAADALIHHLATRG